MVEMGPYATFTDASPEADSMARARSQAAVARAGIDRRAILARTVELDVIPQLLMRRFAATRAQVIAAVTIAEVAELADITLGANDSETSRFVTEIRQRGVALDAVYLDLLAPVARRLGEWWEDDICDFMQVTNGLWRLQVAMRDVSPAVLASSRVATGTRQTAPRVLLAPLPGEQHTFGLSMVHEFFRRGGWDAWSGPLADRAELAAMVRHQWVDVVGFSLACDERMDSVAPEIRAVRLASRNPGLAVMVGGPPFIAKPGLAAELGADGTAENGLQAVAAAGELLRRAAERAQARGA